jgi:NAD(P)-dependent dehydrogenase (short-subunit alcohol dehydrogenase family)
VAAPKRAVLITGCSSGIGRATALRLAAAGWPVYATARKPETLNALADAGCRTLALDVTDEASMIAAVAELEREHGAVGVLINNAGYGHWGPIEETPLDVARGQFETNVFGLARLTQLALPGMRRQRWGKVVNIGSMAGRLTFPGGGLYHATKHALEAISDALRFEVGGFGIDVILVQPGLIRTRFNETAVGGMPPGSANGPYGQFSREVARITASSYVSGILGKLAGGPDDVAKTIEKAILAKRPKARYPVTMSAHVLMGIRALLPDRLWDAFLAGPIPGPGRSRARVRGFSNTRGTVRPNRPAPGRIPQSPVESRACRQRRSACLRSGKRRRARG